MRWLRVVPDTNAQVIIRESARVYGIAHITGKAVVKGEAKVCRGRF